VAHILLIVVCIAALAALVRQQFFPQSSRPSYPELTGKRIVIPGMDVPMSPGLAVVVAVRSDCKFCGDSLAFYREIENRRRASKNPIGFFFVSPEPTEKTVAFVRKTGVSADRVISVDFKNLGIALTPTLAIVDSDGLVKKAYYGKLTDKKETDLLTLVDNPAF